MARLLPMELISWRAMRTPLIDMEANRGTGEFDATRTGGCRHRRVRALEEAFFMVRRIVQLLREDRGEDLVEYGLLVAFAAAVITAALINDPVGWKPALIAAFTKVKNALDNIVP